MTELSILLVAILMLVAALIAAMVYMAKKVGGKGEKELRSVTRLLFLTTQIGILPDCPVRHGSAWTALPYC